MHAHNECLLPIDFLVSNFFHYVQKLSTSIGLSSLLHVYIFFIEMDSIGKMKGRQRGGGAERKLCPDLFAITVCVSIAAQSTTSCSPLSLCVQDSINKVIYHDDN